MLISWLTHWSKTIAWWVVCWLYLISVNIHPPNTAYSIETTRRVICGRASRNTWTSTSSGNRTASTDQLLSEPELSGCELGEPAQARAQKCSTAHVVTWKHVAITWRVDDFGDVAENERTKYEAQAGGWKTEGEWNLLTDYYSVEGYLPDSRGLNWAGRREGKEEKKELEDSPGTHQLIRRLIFGWRAPESFFSFWSKTWNDEDGGIGAAPGNMITENNITILSALVLVHESASIETVPGVHWKRLGKWLGEEKMKNDIESWKRKWYYRERMLRRHRIFVEKQTGFWKDVTVLAK